MTAVSGISTTVVIVTYNSAHQIADCVRALGIEFSGQIVVVDNGSRDGTVRIAQSLGCRTISHPRNLGFGRACNDGAAAASADWIVFVNPDVRISWHSLVAMIELCPPAVAVVSPLLKSYKGAALADIARAKPTAPETIGRNLFGRIAEVQGNRFRRALTQSRDRHCFVPVTSGACMAIRADVFRTINGFDSTFFLNGEDVALCVDVLRLGHSIAVDTHVPALHDKSSSSTGVVSTDRFYENLRAEMRLARREFSRGSLPFIALALIFSAVARGLIPAISAARSTTERELAVKKFFLVSKIIVFDMWAGFRGRELLRPSGPEFV